MREFKRRKGQTQRRERLAEKGGLVEAGEVVEGYVREVPFCVCALVAIIEPNPLTSLCSPRQVQYSRT